MARKKKTINITNEQLNEVVVSYEEIHGKGNGNVGQNVVSTYKKATAELGANKVDGVSVPASEINDSKVYTKKQVVEARKKHLQENSVTYNKKELFNLLKK